ncbi:enoyl-CoA hydratase-related protein [Derxia gummosa]|uniref:Enoyl-CoA hydratase-related protein n=1 Tax=Derxia gummosa DSM 723 TaxID=1121388 RepID=A0A8B6X4A2_9BURK|nr:enoyl-CoA hydratase-related protein [Derxia gummosa]
METLALDVDARGVARLEMARAEVFNAFNETMIGELAESFDALGRREDVRVILLCGRGKAFSAGADLQWMKRQSAQDEAANLADARRFADMMRAVAECPKPTVARVQGSAFGGGVGLMAACDIVVAASHARFAVSEARFGILPAVIGPYVVNAVGVRQARRLALTATQVTADEARAMGLVHRTVPAEELDAAIDAVLLELLGNGPAAQGEIKRLFAQLEVGPVTPAVRELTAATIARVRSTDEAREGFAAFFDKRPAAWSRA